MDNKEILIAGYLLESAETQKEMAEKAIKRLEALTRSLEPSVRQAVGDATSEAVAHAAQAEFAQLRSELQRTAQALQGIRGGVSWNLGVLASGIALVTVLAAVGGIYLFGGYRSGGQVAAPAAPAGLRGDPAVLAEIARRGLQVDVSLCGEARRPCVKVDPKAGGFGPRKDLMILPAKPAP